MARKQIKGMFGGLGITFKTMLKPAVTVQYPHEREDPRRAPRGVIALKEENCTVCMLCARSCPDWCIYIEGHKEKRPPRREGGATARSASSTASTSTTRCACTAVSASRCAPSTRCSGARSTSTPSPASRRSCTTRTASASGWSPFPSPSRSSSAPKSREEMTW